MARETNLLLPVSSDLSYQKRVHGVPVFQVFKNDLVFCVHLEKGYPHLRGCGLFVCS